MKHHLTAIFLVFTFMAGYGHAADTASDSALAAKFSPILILTEEKGGEWGDIRVLKPEPVGIVGAESADNLKFQVYNPNGGKVGKVRDLESLNFDNWQPSPPKIDFSQDRFAFLTRKYQGQPLWMGDGTEPDSTMLYPTLITPVRAQKYGTTRTLAAGLSPAVILPIPIQPTYIYTIRPMRHIRVRSPLFSISTSIRTITGGTGMRGLAASSCGCQLEKSQGCRSGSTGRGVYDT